MKKVVIIGSGLGGTILAYELLKKNFDIHVVDPFIKKPQNKLPDLNLIDKKGKKINSKFMGVGLGGSTQFWHAGLMEIERKIFNKSWPYKYHSLKKYISLAFELISGQKINDVSKIQRKLKYFYYKEGIDSNLLPNIAIYYPRKVENLWNKFNLYNEVNLYFSKIKKWVRINNNFKYIVLENGQVVQGDIFIIAAGGIITPTILEKISTDTGFIFSNWLGAGYECHPATFVAKIEFKKSKFSKICNFQTPNGSLRQPLLVYESGLPISFFLRPNIDLNRDKRKKYLKNYFKYVFKKSFKNLNLVIFVKNFIKLNNFIKEKFLKNYSNLFVLHMAASIPITKSKTIYKKKNRLINKFYLDKKLKIIYNNATDKIIQKLFPLIKNYKLINRDLNNLGPSAHNSGTARISQNSKNGVCDKEGKIYNSKNLFVCDASLIPNSGISNTGLTIAALAIKQANEIKKKFGSQKVSKITNIDFVISGASGNVGIKLIPLLQKSGFKIESLKTFKKNNKNANVFINLQNISSDPYENFLSFKQNLSIVENRVKKIIQAQTIATMPYNGLFDQNKFNGGFKPKYLSNYTLGKLMLEKEIIKKSKKKDFPCIYLLYFGHVIEAGGPWKETIKIAKKKGYILPKNMTTGICNELKIKDIFTSVSNILNSKKNFRKINRELLVSNNVSWKKILGKKNLELDQLKLNLKFRIIKNLRNIKEIIMSYLLILIWNSRFYNIILKLKFKKNYERSFSKKQATNKNPIFFDSGLRGRIFGKQNIKK